MNMLVNAAIILISAPILSLSYPTKKPMDNFKGNVPQQELDAQLAGAARTQDYANEITNDTGQGDGDSTTTSPMTMFVVTELYLPHPPVHHHILSPLLGWPRPGENYMGVQVLGIFTSRNEAEQLATSHMNKLKQLTKKPDPGNGNLNPLYERPFYNKFANEPTFGPLEDSTTERKIEWTERTTVIRVKQEMVYQSMASVPDKQPLWRQNLDSIVHA